MTGISTDAVKPLVLTMGEPAGVGGEITFKAWRKHRGDLPPFFTIDDPMRLTRLAEMLDLEVPIRIIEDPEQAVAAFPSGLPVLPLALAIEPIPGKPDPANAGMVRKAIEDAVAYVRAGRADAIVTNPIQKSTLYQAGFDFPGHTEFLADLAGIDTPPVMMLACTGLRVSLVTVHISLRDVLKTLKTSDIVEIAMISEAALRRDFGIAKPRLAVAGLNPHAGEGGAMGSEEAEIIEPAIANLLEAGLDVFGPAPPDTLFGERARKGYDIAICMYHDQALIPIKTLDFDGGVNVTLGLPFVRTSPDHGTALDIAGTGIASETSLVAALKMASGMASRRTAAGR